MEKEYYTVTIPKGTVLFRATNTTYDLVKDYAGIPKGHGEFCLFPNFNVFFYPYPFASESVGKYDYTCIYILQNDIKLINLISPSPYTRYDRVNKKGGILSCSDITDFKGCTDFGKKYDPCIDFNQIKDDNIVGMIAIAKMDAQSLKKLLSVFDDENNNNNNNNRYKKIRHREVYYNEYYKLYKDTRGLIGVPEIILYPRKKIVQEGITEVVEDYSQYMINNSDLFNYKLFHIVRGSDDLQIVMESLKNNSFKMDEDDDQTYGIALNKKTGFYQLLNLTDKNIPLDKDNDLTEKHKEFEFESGTLEELDNLNNILFVKEVNEWVSLGNDKTPLVLDDLGLVEIPDLPSNIRALSLSGNKIKTLNNLPKALEILNIDYNKITEIENLPNTLKTLIISNNPIRELVSLPNSLTHLEANNCKINYIDKFTNNLTIIELNNNYLEEIPNLPNGLKILKVEGNSFRSLPTIPRSVTVFKYDEPENINVNNI